MKTKQSAAVHLLAIVACIICSTVFALPANSACTYSNECDRGTLCFPNLRSASPPKVCRSPGLAEVCDGVATCKSSATVKLGCHSTYFGGVPGTINGLGDVPFDFPGRRCVQLLPLGADCGTQFVACDVGAICDYFQTGQCIPQPVVGLGQSCAFEPCVHGLYCHHYTNGTSICVAYPNTTMPATTTKAVLKYKASVHDVSERLSSSVYRALLGRTKHQALAPSSPMSNALRLRAVSRQLSAGSNCTQFGTACQTNLTCVYHKLDGNIFEPGHILSGVCGTVVPRGATCNPQKYIFCDEYSEIFRPPSNGDQRTVCKNGLCVATPVGRLGQSCGKGSNVTCDVHDPLGALSCDGYVCVRLNERLGSQCDYGLLPGESTRFCAQGLTCARVNRTYPLDAFCTYAAPNGAPCNYDAFTNCSSINAGCVKGKCVAH